MRRPINWFVFSISLAFLLVNLLLLDRGGTGTRVDSRPGVSFPRVRAVASGQIELLRIPALAIPVSSRVADELEIPGFSEFPNPMTQNLLLDIGSTEWQTVTLGSSDVPVLGKPPSSGVPEIDGDGKIWLTHGSAPARGPS